MGKGSNSVSAPDRKILKEAVESHRPELIRRLDSNTLFLTYLAKHRLIEGNDILRYERHKSRQKRNEDVLDCVLKHEDTVKDSYDKFLDALRRSDQDNLANLITSVEQELDSVDKYQTKLEEHLEDLHDYLKKERRRTQLDFTIDSPSEGDSNKQKSKKAPNADQRAEMTEFIQKVQSTTRSTLTHFDRCKDVIEKLHDDCNTVALKNAELLSKLKDCDGMIKELVPEHALKSLREERVDRDESRLSNSSANRSKRSEAERVMNSIRRKLDLIEEEKEEVENSNQACEKIIDNILNDVDDRRAVLDKHTENPPRDKSGVSKYMADTPWNRSSRSTTRMDPLRVKVEQLAEAMEVYIHQEKQITHKANLSRYQSSGSAHRNFDEIDEDLLQLQKELKKDDKSKALEVARHIVEATKGERIECLKMVDELERTVRTRRVKLQENAARGAGPRVLRRVPQRRVRVVRRTDSSFSKRLNDLNNEVKMYMNLEMDQNQRNQAELLKRRQEYEAQAKQTAQHMKKMEKEMKDIEGERGKFKRLYQQERTVSKSQLLRKPTLVGRRSVMTNRSTTPQTPRRSRYSSAKEDDFEDRREDEDRLRRKKMRNSGAGRVRRTTQETFSDREETPPDAKVRLRNKAQHLMTLKDPDEPRTRLPDIHNKE